MGLKMPGEEDVLSTKVLLMRAGAKSRAKSWLTASAGEETTKELDGLSQTADTDADSVFTIPKTIDENSGIGMPEKSAEDDLSQRQFLSANEALRRKLLSKNAYRRYNEGRQGDSETTKSKSRKVESLEDDEEGKGRSSKRSKPNSASSKDGTETQVDKPATITKTRKRPSNYLDEVLANRKQKQRQTPKKVDDD